jgi:hypothetical protein
VASTKRHEQLIRITSLRRLVGTFARGGDREATAEALVELARAEAEGLTEAALQHARQALTLLAGHEPSEANTRALLQLATVCLGAEDAETATTAADLAIERSALVDEPVRNELAGAGSLLAGIAWSLRQDPERARERLHVARDRFVEARLPAAAALALTQLALVDAEQDRWDAAEVCFRFARDFFRASGDLAATAEVGALAARMFAEAGVRWRTEWLRAAIVDADRAGDKLSAAELLLDLGDVIASEGIADRAATTAAEALPYLRQAFTHAIRARDEQQLANVVEVLVRGLVRGRLDQTAWQLLDKFRDELSRWGFHTLADSARQARDLLDDHER